MKKISELWFLDHNMSPEYIKRKPTNHTGLDLSEIDVKERDPLHRRRRKEVDEVQPTT